MISIDIGTHTYIGLFLGTLTSDFAQDAGIPVNLKGVYVDRITQNGPADKAGIHGSTTVRYLKKYLGDVIIAVDGHNITKSGDLINYIGQNYIYRNGHAIDVKATLTARPSLLPFLTKRSASSPLPHPPIRPPTIPHS